MAQIDLRPAQRTQLSSTKSVPIGQQDRSAIPVELRPRLRAASISLSTSVSVRYSLCLYAAFGCRRGSVRFAAIGVVSVIDDLSRDGRCLRLASVRFLRSFRTQGRATERSTAMLRWRSQPPLLALGDVGLDNLRCQDGDLPRREI
jgi:hypothetical protein